MKANAGGQIDVDSVVGRDDLITQIWDTLEQQSVIKTAERRIGKTTIAKKMLAEPRTGWTAVLQDLEQYHSAMDFAMSVYREVDRFLSKKQKASRRAKEFIDKIGGTEIGGMMRVPKQATASWKDILKTSITDLLNERDPEDEERLVFLWDEMPFMLANIRDREGEQTAMEVLDVLRALRQDNNELRMVITGSIGLHHVLGTLKKAGYANSPTNDMFEIDVGPLTHAHAVELASKLISGEHLDCPDPTGTADAIAREADGFPFYIHHIVKALRLAGDPVGPKTVVEMVNAQISDDRDPWELQHYEQRIGTYYGNDAAVVTRILDDLALRTGPVAIDELLAALKNVSQFDDREKLLSLMRLLVQDHYLSRDSTGTYEFRFPLIKRWWKLHRAL